MGVGTEGAGGFDLAFRRLLIVPVLIGAAVLAACETSDEPAPTDKVPEGSPYMDQRGLAFRPSNLTVQAGEQVYFLNNETALHNVVVDGEDISGNMRNGDVVVYVFEEAGEYAITCDYHPQMKATVIVE
jgi:plastocyanin